MGWSWAAIQYLPVGYRSAVQQRQSRYNEDMSESHADRYLFGALDSSLKNREKVREANYGISRA